MTQPKIYIYRETAHITDNCITSTLVCLNGGYPDPRNSCNTCRCPSGFAGTTCNMVQNGINDSCTGQTFTDSLIPLLVSGYIGDLFQTYLSNVYDCYMWLQVSIRFYG
jgi:hypothetical protein